MKILHTTDLHFNKNWFEWIANQQNNFDVFCITGDFLDDFKEEQIDWLTNWMKNFKKPLFICSGNHDIEELENEDWFNKISNVYSAEKGTGYFNFPKLGLPLLFKVDNIPCLVATSTCHCSCPSGACRLTELRMFSNSCSLKG